jgi:predicted nucleic acid-binding protein
MNLVIVDTGPLVAWFCPKDAHHLWARRTVGQMPAGAIICEAVLTEVCHLAAKDGIARGKVIEFVERGRLVPVPLTTELPAIRELLERYADLPMDFADACLVRMTETNEHSSVLTTDSHFRIYRRNGRQIIPLRAPPGI